MSLQKTKQKGQASKKISTIKWVCDVAKEFVFIETFVSGEEKAQNKLQRHWMNCRSQRQCQSCYKSPKTWFTNMG